MDRFTGYVWLDNASVVFCIVCTKNMKKSYTKQKFLAKMSVKLSMYSRERRNLKIKIESG